MEDYIKKLNQISESIFDDETSKKIANSFDKSKLINPKDFVKGKPITKKKLLGLNIEDVCFVKFWDDDGELRGNEFKYLDTIDEDEIVFFVDFIGSIFSASFELSNLNDDTILENIYEDCGWRFSIYEAKKINKSN